MKQINFKENYIHITQNYKKTQLRKKHTPNNNNSNT